MLHLRSPKHSKQPGPNGLHMELLKWLNCDNRQHLLDLTNNWSQSEAAMKDLFVARVMSVF